MRMFHDSFSVPAVPLYNSLHSACAEQRIIRFVRPAPQTAPGKRSETPFVSGAVFPSFQRPKMTKRAKRRELILIHWIHDSIRNWIMAVVRWKSLDEAGQRALAQPHDFNCGISASPPYLRHTGFAKRSPESLHHDMKPRL
jgi:hypothetical protein